MLELMKTENNRTYTENGAVTYKTTGSDVLNLFSSVGALRHCDDLEIARRITRAYHENSDLTLKLMFYARDIRYGLGERHIFRVFLKWASFLHPEVMRHLIPFLPEYGRYDDCLTLLDTPCEEDVIAYLKNQLVQDLHSYENNQPVSLLAKWMPSNNTSNPKTVEQAKKLAKAFGMSDRAYRKTLVKLRGKMNLVENHLRTSDYTFMYDQLPSRAQYKYRNAFIRNDKERYKQYIQDVSVGKTTMHTDTIAPYELIRPFINKSSLSEDEKNMLNTAWASLPDYGNEENTLAIIDTSGSMYWGTNPVPGTVALSLGMYFAEHSKGVFKNHFIEFSSHPELIEIKGETFADRLEYILSFNEIADTNLEAVFDLILDTAIKNHVSQDELPSKLVIFSDMEFNQCVTNADFTNFESAKYKFNKHGYQLPEIIFWNVSSRNQQVPARMNDCGVALVSGCSTQIFNMIAGGNLRPYQFMLDILLRDRYACITTKGDDCCVRN